MVGHTYNASTWEAKEKESPQVQNQLVYLVSSRQLGQQNNNLSLNKQTNIQKTEFGEWLS